MDVKHKQYTTTVEFVRLSKGRAQLNTSDCVIHDADTAYSSIGFWKRSKLILDIFSTFNLGSLWDSKGQPVVYVTVR